MIREACIEDLQDYFKISDLLGGLTPQQQKQLRTNIGLDTDDNGVVISETLTYDELQIKIKNKSLVAGMHYIISDYQTIYKSNHIVNGIYETWGHNGLVPSQVWTLVTTAVTSDQLSKFVLVVEHPEYEVHYDVTQKVFEDGISNKGTITYLKDSNNNSAYYDFKNVRFRRTTPQYTRNYYTFSYADAGIIKDASETNLVHDNKLESNCWNNVFLGETYYNIMEADSYDNTFFSGCHDCHFYWETCKNVFNEQVNDLSGTIANQYIEVGDNTLSTAITKQVHNVNDAVIVTFLDPITYAQQIIILSHG